MTLVSVLNIYMSCESIQISWFQVWFNLMKNSSIVEIFPILEKSEWAVILAMFEWSKLIGLEWNWCACSRLMVWDSVEISWELDKRCFGFGVDLVNYSAAVFSM